MFTSDERLFITASLDGLVHVFDTASGRKVRTLASRTTGLIALTASPDSSRIFAGSVDGYITVWDPQVGREVAMFQSGTKLVMGMDYLPDGRLITSSAGGVRFWNGIASQ
jgi:WD40 repeat protein